MRKFIFSLVIFITLPFGIDRLFYVFNYPTTNIWQIFKDNKTSNLYENYFNSNINSDIIFMGSSHTQFGFDCEWLNRKYANTPVFFYNYAFGGCTVKDAELLLDEYLYFKKKPKLIIYGIEYFQLNDTWGNEFIISHFSCFRDLSAKMKALSLNFGTLFPTYSNIYTHRTELKNDIDECLKAKRLLALPINMDSEFDLSMFVKYDSIGLSQGQVRGYGSPNIKYLRYTEQKFVVSLSRLEDLQNLINKCKKGNIELVFVEIPEYYLARYAANSDNYNQMNKLMDSICDTNGTKYYSFNDSSQFDMKNDMFFFDTDHLNKAGAEKFTNLADVKLLSKYIATLKAN